jgi:hypothetical protein
MVGMIPEGEKGALALGREVFFEVVGLGWGLALGGRVFDFFVSGFDCFLYHYS